MNTDQVVEMIDAITEGRRYVLPITKNEAGNHELKMRTNSEEILFYIEGTIAFAGPIDDPRTAREIAGALVAWANRKDGRITHLADAIVGNIRWAEFTEKQSEVTGPSPADIIKLMSGRDTKADWFTRNVGNMSIETLRRNFNDLMRITKMKALPDTERAELNKVKDIVWKALKEKDPTAKQCQRCLLLNDPLHSKFCEDH